MSEVRRGIDISAHNGNINLAALKSQIDFVIIRVGFGTKGTLDNKFKRNVELCKSLGIPFGFYWYSYALNEAGAEKEARACLNAIAPYKNDYSMGVWFDMEDADGYKKKNGMPSNLMLRKICAKFCSILKSADYYIGIYASQSWFNNQLKGNEIARYDKWVAQWPMANGKQLGLNVSPNKTGLSLWQFTAIGKFSGYAGVLDVNYAYKNSYTNNVYAQPKKTIDEIAQEVLEGKWGNGEERKRKIIDAGYDYDAVQSKINSLLSKKKTIEEIAKEVIDGKWGNGTERKTKLEAAGYNYLEVQKKVAELTNAKNKKSLEEIAKEVIAGKWGSGTTRKAQLEAAGYSYIEVQKKVNELMNKK